MKNGLAGWYVATAKNASANDLLEIMRSWRKTEFDNQNLFDDEQVVIQNNSGFQTTPNPFASLSNLRGYLPLSTDHLR